MGDQTKSVQVNDFPPLLTLCFPFTAHISLSAWPDRHVSFCKKKKKEQQHEVSDTCVQHNKQARTFSTLSFHHLSTLWWMVQYFLWSPFSICGLREQLVVRILPGKEWSHSCRILSGWLGTPDLCGRTTKHAAQWQQGIYTYLLGLCVCTLIKVFSYSPNYEKILCPYH